LRGWHAVCAHASRRRPPLCCSYNKTALKIVGKGGQRWYKNVGLGFRTPKEAIEGELGCCRRGNGQGRGPAECASKGSWTGVAARSGSARMSLAAAAAAAEDAWSCSCGLNTVHSASAKDSQIGT
jgi:hypothetical protein